MRTSLARLLQQAGHAVKAMRPRATSWSPSPIQAGLHAAGPRDARAQRPRSAAAMRRRGEDMPIVFMSAYGDIPRTVLAIKGGASDFLVKPFKRRNCWAPSKARWPSLLRVPCRGSRRSPARPR